MICCVERDALDYIEAAGVLVSLILAGAALWFAKRSADAADRSAVAADDTAATASRTAKAAETTAAAATQEAAQTRELVEIARDQHRRLLDEASRAPEFSPPQLVIAKTLDPNMIPMGFLRDVDQMLDAPMPREFTEWVIVFEATFRNVGNKAAEQALARFAVPDPVRLLRSGPAGEDLERVDLSPLKGYMLRLPGTELPAYAHAWRFYLPPNQPEILYATLIFDEPGSYELELQIDHEDAELVRQRFMVTLPPSKDQFPRIERAELTH